jgi:hypothetical protein
MLSERILDGFVLALLIVAGAFLEGVGGAFLWVGAALAGGIAVAAFVLGRLGERVLRGRLSGIERGLAVFRTTRVVALALGVTAGIWLADVVMYGALARGFHLDLSVAQILLLVGAGTSRSPFPARPPESAASSSSRSRARDRRGRLGARCLRARRPRRDRPAADADGAMLARVALPKAFRLRREPGGVAA